MRRAVALLAALIVLAAPAAASAQAQETAPEPPPDAQPAGESAPGDSAVIPQGDSANIAPGDSTTPSEPQSVSPAVFTAGPYTLTGDRLTVRREGDQDVVRFEGHVVYRSGGTLVRSEWGEYTSADKSGRFGGNVEIFHEETLLRGPLAVVREEGGRLEFPEGVVVIDADRTLGAENGVFDLEQETGVLWNHASVLQEKRSLEADTLHLLSGARARALGNVLLIDPDEKTRVTGDEAILEDGRTRCVGRPRLLRFDDTGEVEANVEADTLLFAEGGALEAIGRVRIEQQGTVATAERARIDDAGDRADLEGSPRVVKGEQNLSGDHLVLEFAEAELTEVLALGNAQLTRYGEIVAEPPEREGLTADGDTIRLEVEADSLRRAVVWGNARSKTERTTPDGGLLERNEVQGDSLILDVGAGESDRVRVVGAATGRYAPRTEGGSSGMPPPQPAAHDTTAAPPDTVTAPRDTTAAPLDTTTAPPGTTPPPPDSAAAPLDTSGTTVILAPDTSAAARDTAGVVAYSAREIEFRTGEREIVLIGGAKLDYLGMHLEADTVRYDLDRAVLNATGDPKLRQGGEEVTGHRMGYALEERKGIVYGGETTYQTGRLRGGEVVRLDEGTLDVRHGEYTSCDQKPPHYHFESRLMRVYLDDKSVARPVVLYIHDIPVVGLPFYMLPLTKERRSGFLLPNIEFGFSESKGRFIEKLGYYWVANDYIDFAGWANIYQNRPFTANLETSYALRYVLSGNVYGSYSTETSEGSNTPGYEVHASHRQELGERAGLTARGDFVSSSQYRLDQGRTVYDLDRELKSDITLQKSWTSQSVTLTATRREELDLGDVTSELPRLSYSRQRFPIFGSARSGEAAPWYGTTYAGMSGNLINSRKKVVNQTTGVVGDTTGVEADTTRFASEALFSLSNSMKLFGWLGLSPSADGRATIYDRDNLGNPWPERFVWSARASANTNLYGTWWPRLGPLTGIRHIMTPSVSFGYSPEFDQYLVANAAGVPNSSDQFPAVPGIGGTPRGTSQSLGLSVNHTFQLKLGEGEGERSIEDLLIVGQSISRDLERGGESWSRLGTSVRLRPARRWDVNVSMSHDIYDLTLESTSIQNQLSLDGAMFGKRERVERDDASGESDQPGSEDGAQADDEPEMESAAAASELPRGQAGRERQSGPWTLGFSHSYSKSRKDEPVHRISSSLRTSLTPNWYLDYAPFYDFREHEVISQSFTLIRNLHCWEATFRGDYLGGDWEYYFSINIRAHQEVGYKLGREADLYRGLIY